MRGAAAAAGLLLALSLASAALPLAGSFARPTATVVSRAAPLFDAASPAAEPTGSLREGEVVPVLEASGDWLRVEDNAGARGWARAPTCAGSTSRRRRRTELTFAIPVSPWV